MEPDHLAQMWESVTRRAAALLSPNSPSSAFHPLAVRAEPPHLLFQFCPPPNPTLANPKLSKGTTVVFLDIQFNTSNTPPPHIDDESL